MAWVVDGCGGRTYMNHAQNPPADVVPVATSSPDCPLYAHKHKQPPGGVHQVEEADASLPHGHIALLKTQDLGYVHMKRAVDLKVGGWGRLGHWCVMVIDERTRHRREWIRVYMSCVGLSNARHRPRSILTPPLPPAHPPTHPRASRGRPPTESREAPGGAALPHGPAAQQAHGLRRGGEGGGGELN